MNIQAVIFFLFLSLNLFADDSVKLQTSASCTSTVLEKSEELDDLKSNMISCSRDSVIEKLKNLCRSKFIGKIETHKISKTSCSEEEITLANQDFRKIKCQTEINGSCKY